MNEQVGDWQDDGMKHAVFTSVNDASRFASTDIRFNGLTPGDTEIWYATNPRFNTEGIDPDNLEATHTLLGKVACADLELIFLLMQGEMWSPTGQANELILEKGLSHTSMSVGDVVKSPDGIYVCDMIGWKNLNG